MPGNIYGLIFSSVTGTACFLWEKIHNFKTWNLPLIVLLIVFVVTVCPVSADGLCSVVSVLYLQSQLG